MKPIWERLCHARTKFDLNRQELNKDVDAAANLKRIDDILKAEAPYGMIKDAEGLIQKVSAVNDALIQNRRDRAIEKIDGYTAWWPCVLCNDIANLSTFGNTCP